VFLPRFRSIQILFVLSHGHNVASIQQLIKVLMLRLHANINGRDISRGAGLSIAPPLQLALGHAVPGYCAPGLCDTRFRKMKHGGYEESTDPVQVLVLRQEPGADSPPGGGAAWRVYLQ
jgi:hypothetical protein